MQTEISLKSAACPSTPDLESVSLPARMGRALCFVPSWGLFAGCGLLENGSDVRFAAHSDRAIIATLPLTISGFSSSCTIPLHSELLRKPNDQLSPLKEAFHHIVMPLLLRPLGSHAFQDLRRELSAASSHPDSSVKVLAESPMSHRIFFRIRIGERCTYMLDSVVRVPAIGEIDVQATIDRGQMRFDIVPLDRKFPATELAEPLVHLLKQPSAGRAPVLKRCIPLIEDFLAHP